MILMFGLIEQGQGAANELSSSSAPQTSGANLGPGEENLKPQGPVVKHAIPLFKAQVKPARVRIGIELTPYRRMVTKKIDGQAEAKFMPIDAMRHTLRARLDQSNHFFVGDYHIITNPVSWESATKRYVVRLSISQSYGATGTLEEAIGSIDVNGILTGDPRVYDLQANAQQRFRAKTGQFQLDVRIMPPELQNPATSTQANKDSLVTPRSL